MIYQILLILIKIIYWLLKLLFYLLKLLYFASIEILAKLNEPNINETFINENESIESKPVIDRINENDYYTYESLDCNNNQSFDCDLKLNDNQINFTDYLNPHDDLKTKIIRVENWSSSSDYYYHYTSVLNAVSILINKKINANPARVHCFGYGVFLTNLDPILSNHDLVVNNYRGNYKYYERTFIAFAFPKTTLKVKKITDKFNQRRDVLRHNGDIYLTDHDFRMIIRSYHCVSFFTCYV